ncbi:uncharacterized protein LOC144753965 isoform X2 [Lissotriton helveticus]
MESVENSMESSVGNEAFSTSGSKILTAPSRSMCPLAHRLIWESVSVTPPLLNSEWSQLCVRVILAPPSTQTAPTTVDHGRGQRPRKYCAKCTRITQMTYHGPPIYYETVTQLPRGKISLIIKNYIPTSDTTLDYMLCLMNISVDLTRTLRIASTWIFPSGPILIT